VKFEAPEPRGLARRIGTLIEDAAEIPSFKKDVVAFRVVVAGIALQDDRLFGRLVNCLDQLGIVFVASPIDPP
jgi:hypothetical protein